ncbi:MAG: diguanylate cyclase [bacterium]|nr:diguanylate cyclase [bacterium]
MTLTLILPWFPIVLAVGVGSRLLDRARGIGFGVLGALFWVVLVQSVTGPGVYTEAWSVLSLIMGAVAIVAVGAWSGEEAVRTVAQSFPHRRRPRKDQAAESRGYAAIAEALRRSDDWLEAHRYLADPWPDFGEFIRSALNTLCGATHVQPYRMLSEGDQLIPLRALVPGDKIDPTSAREGITGHVVTSGTSYVAGDTKHGQLVDRLAEESDEQVAWCFAIRQGSRTIGLVKAGHLDLESQNNRPLLGGVEALIGQFWAMLTEVCRSRVAETRDPVSGVLTREPFLIEADRVLHAAYSCSEPVVVAAVALEGTRRMTDRGAWELAEVAIAEASSLLMERLRPDDRLSRFDDSHFVLLLRRVDSALGTLIVEQLLAMLNKLVNDTERWGSRISVRCGVAGSGTDRPRLSDLISRSMAECHKARRAGVPLSSDLEATSPDTGQAQEAPLALERPRGLKSAARGGASLAQPEGVER